MVAPYTDDDFLDDMVRVTRGRTDADLARVLVGESRATMDWLRDLGLRFELMYHRQAYEADGRQRFWGGLAVGVVVGGKGMVEQHLAAAPPTLAPAGTWPWSAAPASAEVRPGRGACALCECRSAISSRFRRVQADPLPGYVGALRLVRTGIRAATEVNPQPPARRPRHVQVRQAGHVARTRSDDDRR